MTIDVPGHAEPLRPGKLLCIGRNYAEHAAEMKSEVPDEPMVFLKPSTALVRDEGTVVLPPQSEEVHHEVELVAVIGTGGKNIAEADALGHVTGYAAGLDMTARDLQREAKERRHPWSVAKGFDTFAPLGPIAPPQEAPGVQEAAVRLLVNGETRQDGHTRHMIFSVAQLVAYCSRVFTLEAGDLIYTGTPEGVGPVEDGDQLEARVEGLPPLRMDVGR
ncbi:MAG: isomerase/hydrolase [Bacteroidetes bacterium QS_8_68_28]|nr:MAG: isomerase/hydrolase [Bacteroidetes bacterium QS_8_68_28]